MKIKVAPSGSPPIASEYELSSSPAEYGQGICTLHRSLEWKLMVKMGLEVEYSVLVLTHEEALHAVTAKLLHRIIQNDSILHLGDICALMGF